MSDVAFAPAQLLSRHRHPNGCIAVVIDGVVDKAFARRSATAKAGTLVTMPPEEPHVDAFGRAGARIVVAETQHDVQIVSWRRDWNATLIALRIAQELEAPDAFTPLAVEGLVLELAAATHRAPRVPRTPLWLESVREVLHDGPREAPSLDELAASVGVHPTHLARSFRARYGESVGSYARRVRLEWAARQLVATNAKLGALAYEAGFADQSHFTRAFKRFAGMPPGRYRDAHR